MKALAAAVALTALLALPAQAQKSVNLQARTAGDLAELCGANPKEPQADAKINFCHGFAQGVITVELRRTEGKKAFCFPSSPPSRSATMNEFVEIDDVESGYSQRYQMEVNALACCLCQYGRVRR